MLQHFDAALLKYIVSGNELGRAVASKLGRGRV